MIRHIEARYHFLRELVEHKVLNIKFTECSSQRVDILTNPLGLEAFVNHCVFLINFPGYCVLSCFLFELNCRLFERISAGRAFRTESWVLIISF